MFIFFRRSKDFEKISPWVLTKLFSTENLLKVEKLFTQRTEKVIEI